MKEIIKHEAPLGGEGAKFQAQLGVEGEFLSANIAVQYPIEKLVTPALDVINNLVDQIEEFIPGDQKEMATKLKLEAKEALVKALSEQV